MALDTYTSAFAPRDIPDDVSCLVFADKRQLGGEYDSGVAMPLSVMLTERFPQDHHFVCYTTPQSMRLRKDMAEPMRFDFCSFDLDCDNHQSKPTADDFEQIVFSCFVMHYGDVPLPNVIYATRGGARLVYLIKPLFDANLFERHVKALAKKMTAPLANGRKAGSHKYDLDAAALDWTRLFRCPLVVRGDVPEYDHPVRFYHGGLLDLLRFKPAKRKEYVIRATGQPITDLEQQQLLVEVAVKMRPGQRNDTLHKTFFKIWKRWPADAEDLFPRIVEIALASGLDRREIEATYRSAERGAMTTG
jgi:hypothetical protein